MADKHQSHFIDVRENNILGECLMFETCDDCKILNVTVIWMIWRENDGLSSIIGMKYVYCDGKERE